MKTTRIGVNVNKSQILIDRINDLLRRVKFQEHNELTRRYDRRQCDQYDNVNISILAS